MTTTNYPHSYYNSIVGFDQIFDELDRFYSKTNQNNYPPSNVIKMDENHYIVQVAVAGFNPNDIDVVLEENTLKVSGKVNEESKIPHEKFIYRGISGRCFSRNFKLHEYMQVNGVELVHGILNVYLEYVLPEEKRPRKIPVVVSEKPSLVKSEVKELESPTS